jgi:hypothetical protein
MLAVNRFSQMWELGYRRLCSVVPPDAPLHPESRLAKRAALGPDKDPRGKAPGRRGHDGRWSGYNFVTHEPTEDDIEAWASSGASVGMKMGAGLVAVDVDTPSEVQAAAVARILDDHLPPAPTRIGNAPKFLLLFRITEDVPYAKVKFPGGHVEIITEGKQFVAFGIHPRTGRPYDWPRALMYRSDVPLITPEQLQYALERIASVLGGDLATAGEAGPAPEQTKLQAPLPLVQKAVNALPNTDDAFPSREDFNRVGYAIKAAAGPDNEDEALDCFQQWAARWDAGYNDPGEVEEEWARMKPPFRIGADWLFTKAEQLGGWTGRAQMHFEPVANAPAPQRSDVYETLDIDAILALEPPKFLIDRHLPEKCLAFVYGRPGCGKSLMVLDMALSLAHGLPAWQGDIISAQDEPVVVYLAREGSAGMKQRIAAWRASRLLPAGVKPKFYLIRAAINFMVPDDIGKLSRTVRSLGLDRVDMIVVDTVSRSLPGADENLQKDMTLFVAACDALIEEHECAVVGVHHAGKSGSMRGSTVLLGAGDAVFHLKRDEGAKIGYLHCEKQKDAPDGWDDPYRFSEVAGSIVVTRVVAEVAESVVQDEMADVLRAMQEAWDARLPWSAFARSERWVIPRICKILNLSAPRSTDLLKRMIDEGLVVHENCYGRVNGYRPAQRAEDEAPAPEPSIFD